VTRRSRRTRRAFGLDASTALIDFARRRLPEADLRVGDMEALPYDEHTFDLVTGFNAFFFANDIVTAIRAAGRVAKPGAPVASPAHPSLSRPGDRTLRQARRARRHRRPGRPRPGAGLRHHVVLPVPPTKRPSAARSSLLPGSEPSSGPLKEETLKDAITDGLAAHRTADGSYSLQNSFHHLIARA